MKRLFFLLAICSCLAIPAATDAAATGPLSAFNYGGMIDSICSVLPFCDRGACLFADIFNAIAKTALPLVGIAAVGTIAYAGVKLIIAGDESGVAEAKKLILTAVIGSLIALSAVGIASYFYYKIIPGATGGSGSTPGACNV